jgi:hypothetical protein
MVFHLWGQSDYQLMTGRLKNNPIVTHLLYTHFLQLYMFCNQRLTFLRHWQATFSLDYEHFSDVSIHTHFYTQMSHSAQTRKCTKDSLYAYQDGMPCHSTIWPNSLQGDNNGQRLVTSGTPTSTDAWRFDSWVISWHDVIMDYFYIVRTNSVTFPHNSKLSPRRTISSSPLLI